MFSKDKWRRAVRSVVYERVLHRVRGPGSRRDSSRDARVLTFKEHRAQGSKAGEPAAEEFGRRYSGFEPRQILRVVEFPYTRQIVLADFGFASKHDGESLSTVGCAVLDTLVMLRTAHRIIQICGTPDYVAPEILKKLPYDSKCDIWSAGVILFILLGGYAPFQASTQTGLFEAIKNGTVGFEKK